MYSSKSNQPSRENSPVDKRSLTFHEYGNMSDERLYPQLSIIEADRKNLPTRKERQPNIRLITNIFSLQNMPIFGETGSPYDEIVEKVTAETLTSENWALMIDICDRVSAEGAKASKQVLISVKKRLNHRDPHVVLLALSLLDCLWNNCGDKLRREISSKEFISELSYKATNSNRIVAEKAREVIKKWVENECKKDSSLSLVESLYKDLLETGYSFESSTDKNSTGKKIPYSNDPNVVFTEEEEADIAKAIALSLNDSKTKEKKGPISYPNFEQTGKSTDNLNNSTSAYKQVKSLYDFEAAEDNELSFNAGELITVIDDSDQNWWRGTSNRGTGLFPASFVTYDLEPSCVVETKQEVVEEQQPEPLIQVQIDEEILLKCIQLLEDLDPTGEVPDSPNLSFYEQMSLAQIPLIDKKLIQIDKQHNMLAQIDVAIRDVLANYDNAVQQVQYQHHNPQHHYGIPPSQASSSNAVGQAAPLTYTSSNSQLPLGQNLPQQSLMYSTSNNYVNAFPSNNSISNIDGSTVMGGSANFQNLTQLPQQQQQPPTQLLNMSSNGAGSYQQQMYQPQQMPHN